MSRGRAGIVGGLHRFLRRASARPQRDVLLEALASELEAERDQLRRKELASSDLEPLLADVRETVEELRSAEEADARVAIRVSSLCAELIELLARGLAPKRRSRRMEPTESFLKAPPSINESLIQGLVLRAPRPIRLPGSSSLAAALTGERVPRATPQRQLPDLGKEPRREGAVRAALAEPAPLEALYAAAPAGEALARHAVIALLGRPVLDDLGLESLRGPLGRVGELSAVSPLAIRAVASRSGQEEGRVAA